VQSVWRRPVAKVRAASGKRAGRGVGIVAGLPCAGVCQGVRTLPSQDILQLELDSLGRLGPGLRALAARASEPLLSAAGGGDAPTLVAARLISAETLPAFGRAVADRLSVVGDRVGRARTAFAAADADRAAVITGAEASPSYAPPPTMLV
jgi:hypothetical protein